MKPHISHNDVQILPNPPPTPPIGLSVSLFPFFLLLTHLLFPSAGLHHVLLIIICMAAAVAFFFTYIGMQSVRVPQAVVNVTTCKVSAIRSCHQTSFIANQGFYGCCCCCKLMPCWIYIRMLHFLLPVVTMAMCKTSEVWSFYFISCVVTNVLRCFFTSPLLYKTSFKSRKLPLNFYLEY